MKTLTRRGMVRRALLPIVVIVFGLAWAVPAAGAAPTLTGETLTASPPDVQIQGTCGDQSGSFTFQASGTATGPYAGTFTETGTATLSAPGGFPGGGIARLVTSLDVSFDIDSPAGHVTGTKTLLAGASPPIAVCQEFGGGDHLYFALQYVQYFATIHTATGTASDSGQGQLVFQEIKLGGTIVSDVYQEIFFQSDTPPGPTAVTLSPSSATNDVGTTHTVTATAMDGSGNPSSNASIVFSVTGAVSTTGSCTTDAQGMCSFTYTGPTAPGSDTITGCADNDGNGVGDPATEPCGQAFKQWVLPTLTVSPADATNTVGTSHTVTAMISSASGSSEAGRTVMFAVTGSVAASGSCVTDASGQCSFTYTGPQLPGADMITACSDLNRNGAIEAATECVTATKAWVLPTSTPGQVTGGGQVPNAAATDQVAFGFNAKNASGSPQGECNVVDPSASKTQVKCLDVTTLVQSGTHATFFGHARVNGTATTYRIDVDDLAEPGRGHDTFKIQTASGYAVGGVLVGGNVQVH